jgi:broad specificity phosphatase PhoE
MEYFETKAVPEKKEKGKNCLLKISFLRHAHKEQMDPHESGVISQSGLSEKGKASSLELGKGKPVEENIKTYVSRMERAQETAENLLLGVDEKEKAPNIKETKIRSQLDAPHFSSGFIEKYRTHFLPKPDNFETLSLDEKEKIIEDMESPAVDYWLEMWDKKFDQETESAKEVAERMAYYFSRFDKMIDKLNSGSKVELLNITHRTTTEPFLKACLKPSINNIQEIGGPLELLEGFEIFISTDSDGKKIYKAILRNKEYEIDLEKVAELKDAYVKKNYSIES